MDFSGVFKSPEVKSIIKYGYGVQLTTNLHEIKLIRKPLSKKGNMFYDDLQEEEQIWFFKVNIFSEDLKIVERTMEINTMTYEYTVFTNPDYYPEPGFKILENDIVEYNGKSYEINGLTNTEFNGYMYWQSFTLRLIE